jgi:hypothetical protein
MINGMGLGYLAFTTLCVYLLITTWPVLEDGATTFKDINIFGYWCSWAPDRQLMFTVVAAAALGSLAHTLTSFGDYVGNRELSTNWIWFLVLRIPIGIALALFFYFLLRGGLLQLQTSADTPPSLAKTTLQTNPYGIAAIAALAGMFSKQATDKLAAVFNALFAMKDPVERGGALGSSKTTLTVVPAALTKGKREDLTVTGSGFEAKTTATLNGGKRDFKVTDPTHGTVATLDEDVKQVGTLELVVTNPNKDAFKASIEVRDPAAAPVKPTIAATDPKELSTTGAKTLKVTGTGFLPGCGATIDIQKRDVVRNSETELIVTLLDTDIASPKTLKLVIKNPGPDGAASDPRDVVVKAG